MNICAHANACDDTRISNHIATRVDIRSTSDISRIVCHRIRNRISTSVSTQTFNNMCIRVRLSVRILDYLSSIDASTKSCTSNYVGHSTITTTLAKILKTMSVLASLLVLVSATPSVLSRTFIGSIDVDVNICNHVSIYNDTGTHFDND